MSFNLIILFELRRHKENPLNDKQIANAGGEADFPEGPPSWPIAEVDVVESIQQALADGSWGQYDARWTAQLVQQLSDMFQCEHTLLCSSGTVAVEIALRGLGIAAESEVVLAGYDFPGNFRAIEAVGARPVLVDVVENGWVMDPAELRAAITPRTSAVVVSHLHGQIADVDQIRSICDENRILLVEDVCQMPGGSIGGRPFCTFGDVAVLSFGGSKLLTAGRGGAMLTDAADVYQRAKIFCNRGNEVYPLSQLQAAAILPQLKTLRARNEQRLTSTRLLIENTSNTTILSPLQQVIEDDNLKPVFYKLPWLIDDVRSRWTRSEFVSAVQAEGLAIDVGFRGFTRRSPRRCRQTGSLTHSRVAAQQTILLHHPVLLENEATIERVAQAINKVANA